MLHHDGVSHVFPALVDSSAAKVITHITIPLKLEVGMLHGEETPFDIITSPKNPLILGFPWL